MITQKVQEKIKEALKAHDEMTLNTMRLLLSALEYSAIDAPGHILGEDKELEIVKREVKKREEASSAYESAGRPEMAKKEREEAVILQQFLPEEISDEKLMELINEIISGGKNSMGEIMKELKQRVGISLDGKKASVMVSTVLQK
jgi:uncharacterized protein